MPFPDRSQGPTVHHAVRWVILGAIAFAAIRTPAPIASAVQPTDNVATAVAGNLPVIRPNWRVGQRLVWEITARQTITRVAPKPEEPAPVPDEHRQTLRLRTTVIGIEQEPGTDRIAGATISFAPEFIRLSRTGPETTSVELNERPDEGAKTVAAEPASSDSPLAPLARAFMATAARADVNVDGRWRSVSGLERLAEFVSEDPAYARALGPLAPGRETLTPLVERLRFIAQAQIPRGGPASWMPLHADGYWIMNRPGFVPGLGRGSLSTRYDVVAIEPASVRLKFVTEFSRSEPPQEDPLRPRIALDPNDRRGTLNWDLADGFVKELTETSDITVTTRLAEHSWAVRVQSELTVRLVRQEQIELPKVAPVPAADPAPNAAPGEPDANGAANR